MRRWLIIGLTIVLVIAAPLLWPDTFRIPDRWNPWARLDLAERPNVLTSYKLGRLRTDPPNCRAVLLQSEFHFTPIPDRVVDQGCMFQNAVQISKSDLSYGSGFPATCALAVALALFERYALQPAAQEVFDQPVVAIEHYGTFACRNVNSAEGAQRSQHALANAIDIAGFRLRDGRQITIRGDWARDSDAGRFLEIVHRRSCDIFRAALGPNYNAAHRDHFHFDMGRYSICQ